MDSPNPYASPRSKPSTSKPRSTVEKSLRRLASLVLGFTAGWWLWYFSPQLFGEVEPWDGEGVLYAALAFVAGLGSTLLFPRNCLYSIIGIYAGQTLYAGLFAHPGGYSMLLLSSIGVLAFGMFPAILGASVVTLATHSIHMVNQSGNAKSEGHRQ